VWTHFFRDGGFGMYPTAIFGFLLLGFQAVSLLNFKVWHLAFVDHYLVRATLASGVLGTCVGFISTFRYLPRVPLEQRFTVAAIGCAESLNNVVLALIVMVLSSILGAIIMKRATTSNDTRRAR
jgi:hypothetical protein